MRQKRAFDLVVLGLAALAWVPVLLVAMVMQLVMSGRPVFYRSNRWVSVGEMVRIVKFRTMVKNAEQLVNRDTVPVTTSRFLNIAPDSPLYTRSGRLLEKFGLTEIPQLVHVIRGEMSIVGNRPLPANVMACLSDEYPYANDRFLTPAGLTGPAQLVGRDLLSDSERLRVEGAYCQAALQNYRLRLDFTVLLCTVLIVAHIKKPLNYQQVIDLIHRNSGKPCTTPRPAAAVNEPGRQSDIV